MELVPIAPEMLGISTTIMTGFMGEPTPTFKTFGELVEIFGRRHRTIAQEGDGSDDLRVLRFEQAMQARQWEGAIVFPRDDDGLIGGGIHRGIAYLRCLDTGIPMSNLPPLLLRPLGTYQWPPGLKQELEAQQHDEYPR